MNYVDRTLIFERDKIYFNDNGDSFEVMMDWEDSIMKVSADYVCRNGGDILEIGFGMGISANYIQANDINSHTIVENHPQIIERLKIWAQDKPNVIIVEGDWYQMKNLLSTYDGVFYDTYGEDNWTKFSDEIFSLVKPGAKVTWWNNEPSVNSIQNIDGVDYESINIDPPSNSYFNSNVYYMPKKQF
tara:strand:- start:1756 stop:2316 length:561 start_codon:yes stop_codon:yes gene_type:complete